MKLDNEIIQFLEKQNFVIVSTIDREKSIHNSCKGIAKINPDGVIYIIDLYKGKTYQNIKRNARISLTAIDEHSFKGYCLKGRGEILPKERISPQLITNWEDKITKRITGRIIRNITSEKAGLHNPESMLPKPQYMIKVEVKKIVNLSPLLKKEA